MEAALINLAKLNRFIRLQACAIMILHKWCGYCYDMGLSQNSSYPQNGTIVNIDFDAENDCQPEILGYSIIRLAPFCASCWGPPTSWARMPGGASSSVTKGWNVWSKHHLSNGRSHPFGSHVSNPQIRLHHLASFTNPCMYILRSSHLWFLGMRASTLYLYI